MGRPRTLAFVDTKVFKNHYLSGETSSVRFTGKPVIALIKKKKNQVRTGRRDLSRVSVGAEPALTSCRGGWGSEDAGSPGAATFFKRLRTDG